MNLLFFSSAVLLVSVYILCCFHQLSCSETLILFDCLSISNTLLLIFISADGIIWNFSFFARNCPSQTIRCQYGIEKVSESCPIIIKFCVLFLKMDKVITVEVYHVLVFLYQLAEFFKYKEGHCAYCKNLLLYYEHNYF